MLRVLIRHINGAIILNREGSVLLDKSELLSTESKFELDGKIGRGFFMISNDFELLVFSDSRADLERPISYLKEIAVSYIDMLRNLGNYITNISESTDAKFKRFTHNIKEANARNIQRLEDLVEIPISDKRFKGKLEELLITESSRQDIRRALLNFKKDSDDIKNEIKAFSLLNSSDPYAQLSPITMSIHGVVLGIINVFFDELQFKRISYELGECHREIMIDYPSVSVIIHHILENSVKYCKNESHLKIEFIEKHNSLELYFGMISLEVLEGEASKIFTEGYSGENARKVGMNGSGIGMFVSFEIAKINKIKIEFIPGEYDSCDHLDRSVRYAFNTVKLSFPI